MPAQSLSGRLQLRGAGVSLAAQRLTPVCLAVAALLVLGKWLVGVDGLFGFDFHGTIWQASRDVIHGRSPYPAPVAHQLLQQGNPAVYPPAIFLLAAPLGFLPATVATGLWDVLMAACLGAALWLVGVRDRRIYAVVFLSLPFTTSMILGQIDGLLALGCALAWRYRDRLAPASAAVALVVVTKLFLWPLAVWLVLTGRRKAALGAALLVLGVLAAAWAAIGFAGLGDYPRLLAALSDAFARRGYSPVATALRLGLPAGVARLAAPALAVVLLAFAFRLGRRGREDRAFGAAVAAGVFGSPIVWMHSTAILLVGFAVVHRRFDARWLLPLALWVSQTEPPRLPQFIATQCVLAVVVATVLGVSAAGPRLAP